MQNVFAKKKAVLKWSNWKKKSTGEKKRGLQTFAKAVWDKNPQQAIKFIFQAVKRNKKLIFYFKMFQLLNDVDYKERQHKSIINNINTKRHNYRLIKKNFRHKCHYKQTLYKLVNKFKLYLIIKRVSFYLSTKSEADVFLGFLKQDKDEVKKTMKVIKGPKQVCKAVSSLKIRDWLILIKKFLGTF